MTVVGVLALQGDFAEHAEMLASSGAQAIQVRYSHELEQLDGLIIPGGESTTVAKLTKKENDDLIDAIHTKSSSGMPVYGTCMGSIFLAKEIEGSSQGRLGLMDINIRRNAFGKQKESHERLLNIPQIGQTPFEAVFIRAPIILSCGTNVSILCQTENGIVMARQDNLLATVFHPELTSDPRIHQYFLSMIDKH